MIEEVDQAKHHAVHRLAVYENPDSMRMVWLSFNIAMKAVIRDNIRFAMF